MQCNSTYTTICTFSSNINIVPHLPFGHLVLATPRVCKLDEYFRCVVRQSGKQFKLCQCLVTL